MNRRDLLGTLAALAGTASPLGAALAQGVPVGPVMPLALGAPQPFAFDALLNSVKVLASQEYREVPRVPDEWVNLEYDQYKTIQFRPEAALWRDDAEAFELQVFPPGLYFPQPITISVVENGEARPLVFDRRLFHFGAELPDLPDAPTLDFSGFRLHTFLNDPSYKSELAVFQGASYFRALARDQVYGLSARGLALRTGDPNGEEFPTFRAFYVERPDAGAKAVTVHAIMDSPSVAGLYTFVMRPGTTTEFDVEARLFPRVDLDHVGIAPQTSMFLFDETNRNRFDDFRPAVHDSAGLLVENGNGEVLWRPLANPLSLQVSHFVDTNPKGFGLMQRARAFDDFADLEANYHKRPSLWVIPGEDWGRGSVSLVEIPADKEIYDNIVAYWRPREPLAAGQEHRFTYRLLWCEEAPRMKPVARVTNTRMGKRVFEAGRLAVIDFEPHEALPDAAKAITVHTSSNRGTVSKGVLQKNPATGGWRLAFTFDPGEARGVELRAQLLVDGVPSSEVWLYRWTA